MTNEEFVMIIFSDRVKIIAVDFDGCLCENKYPAIGAANNWLLYILHEAQRNCKRLILNTCRCGRDLDNAVEWCRVRGLCFDAVNENLPDQIEMFGGDCRKIYADLYLDDRAVNIICGGSVWER